MSYLLNLHALAALLGIVIVLMLTRRWPLNKRILVLVFNLLFLYLFSRKLFLFSAVYVLVNYLGYLWLCHAPKGRRLLFGAAIVINVATVAGLRLFGMNVIEHPLFDAIYLFGLIYTVLKVIDAYYFAYYVGKDVKAPLLDFVNYLLFIPTFTSGPILKFRDFLADSKKPYTVSAADFEAGIKRVILGLFKKVVLVAGMTAVFHNVLDHELRIYDSLFLMIWFYALIYFDFSGYSDIAIGFGRLMGYMIPENFKQPFLSPTLTQYWRNWHATLGDWFRDHIFMIFSRRFSSRWAAAGLSIIIMVCIGLWHGFTWLYVLWGVYHGVLMALESLLQLSLVNRKKVSRTYFYARCALTQLLVTAAVIVYSGNSDVVLRIYRGLVNW
ncbi:MBOAT family O-acyltransferase [Paenibacillus ginsengarvi]|uniref:MBOAT family protein n=1 Tax=Paenibacillus ginsengarvi TaxID=400777 RepID=A0A3B0C4W1_9BACL|nr:MBOAT family O-acyltransferase [Paenibacillus ginsengarvi]RKN78907.1 MBOAT family protein [Paenibacillus ginsengarvi]